MSFIQILLKFVPNLYKIKQTNSDLNPVANEF